MSDYEHRNGEIDVPTISGVYWTYNELGRNRDLTQLAIMPTGRNQMRSLLLGGEWQTFDAYRTKQLGVQWWGPLVAPTEQKL